MSIASEKVKFATERFLLVRLNPARFILPVINAGLYEMSFPFIPNQIARNGVILTKDSSAPVSNDHWYYNASTQLLQIKLASPPDSTSNILIANYYLFYTGTVFRAISEDPEDPSTPIRNWAPLISRYPSFVQSFENILAGVFTISDTEINLINADGDFQQYLSDDDSFYNKDVQIWICLNSVSNIQKVFNGTVQSVRSNQNTVSLRCADGFNVLNQPALMGDDPNEAYFRRDISSFPDLDPAFHDTVCPYIVGSSSRYKTQALLAGVGIPDVYAVNIGTDAPCTDFSSAISVSTNREYGACRLAGIPALQTFGTITRALSVGAYCLASFTGIDSVSVGDTIVWNELGTDYYGIVNYIGPAFTYLGNSYNIVFSDPGSPSVTFSTSSVLDPIISFNVFIQFQDGSIIYPRYQRDYIVSTSITSGGNNYVSILFTNDFESGFSEFGGDPFDPGLHRVFFRTSNSLVETHADILLEIMGRVGLASDASTFAAAETALPVNARFHIPNFDEDDYKSYLEYVQDVLKSTLGYLSINSLFEVEYHLLTAPSSSDVRDTSLTLDSGTSCEIDYADISTSIIAYNPHNDSQQAIDDSGSSPSETRDSAKAKFLHGLVNVDRFRHVLEEITSNIDYHIGIKSMRRATYTFETATQDIDTELGDDVELRNKIVLGGSGAVDVKIMGIEKSPAKIAMTAVDLKGL